LASLVNLRTLHLFDNLLTGSIPAAFSSLVNLEELSLSQNRLSGTIPSTVTSLAKLRTLSLGSNRLSGSIPSFLEKLVELQYLTLSDNRFSGSIPSSLSNLINLKVLILYDNQLSGPIPSELGKLNLNILWLYSNQLTGFPSSLKAAMSLKIFPNPMSSIPYDLVTPASIGTLTNVTWVPYLNTPALLKKRNIFSSKATLTTEELLKTCPLNSGIGSSAGADVAAGCVAGIYQKWCTQPTSSDSTILRQCHDAYNKVFAASIFKSLGDVCPAWKKGPLSNSCAQAIDSFSYSLYMGIGPDGAPVYLQLNRAHAFQLVTSTFGSPVYAPCPSILSFCNWKSTAA
jgi:hypothetical protein